MQKTILRNTSETLACTLQVDRQFWLDTRYYGPYELDTLAYAACYLLRHSGVRDVLVRQAVRLGLGFGKAGKGVSRRIRTRAEALALPGGAAQIVVKVTQGTVTVLGVRL